MIKSPAPKTTELGIDLTSLIDILFILLVFLLLSMQAPRTVTEIELPDVAGISQPLKSPTEIRIGAEDATLYLGDQRYSDPASLLEALKNVSKDTPLVLQSDRDAPFERVLQVLQGLQQHQLNLVKIEVKN